MQECLDTIQAQQVVIQSLSRDFLLRINMGSLTKGGEGDV